MKKSFLLLLLCSASVHLSNCTTLVFRSTLPLTLYVEGFKNDQQTSSNSSGTTEPLIKKTFSIPKSSYFEFTLEWYTRNMIVTKISYQWRYLPNNELLPALRKKITYRKNKVTEIKVDVTEQSYHISEWCISNFFHKNEHECLEMLRQAEDKKEVAKSHSDDEPEYSTSSEGNESEDDTEDTHEPITRPSVIARSINGIITTIVSLLS